MHFGIQVFSRDTENALDSKIGLHGPPSQQQRSESDLRRGWSWHWPIAERGRHRARLARAGVENFIKLRDVQTQEDVHVCIICDDWRTRFCGRFLGDLRRDANLSRGLISRQPLPCEDDGNDGN